MNSVCFCFSKEELRKEFLETTLPARLANYDALLKGTYFMGDKVSC